MHSRIKIVRGEHHACAAAKGAVASIVAERISDGGILHLIKLWLKAPVVEEGEDGKKRTVGGGKANRQGTPQGGVISPLLANVYLHLMDRILYNPANIER